MRLISENHRMARLFLSRNKVRPADARVIVDPRDAYGLDFSGVTYVIGYPRMEMIVEARRRADLQEGELRYVDLLDVVV